LTLCNQNTYICRREASLFKHGGSKKQWHWSLLLSPLWRRWIASLIV